MQTSVPQLLLFLIFLCFKSLKKQKQGNINISGIYIPLLPFLQSIVRIWFLCLRVSIMISCPFGAFVSIIQKSLSDSSTDLRVFNSVLLYFWSKYSVNIRFYFHNADNLLLFSHKEIIFIVLKAQTLDFNGFCASFFKYFSLIFYWLLQ